jgi:hypothetical protein
MAEEANSRNSAVVPIVGIISAVVLIVLGIFFYQPTRDWFRTYVLRTPPEHKLVEQAEW